MSIFSIINLNRPDSAIYNQRQAEIKYRYTLWMKHTKVKPQNRNIPGTVFYYDHHETLPIEMYVLE